MTPQYKALPLLLLEANDTEAASGPIVVGREHADHNIYEALPLAWGERGSIGLHRVQRMYLCETFTYGDPAGRFAPPCVHHWRAVVVAR